MSKCPICSQENSEYNTYCLNCGFKLNNKVKNKKSKSYETSLILSIVLPGISYFYLEQWYRGFLFYVVCGAFFFVSAVFSVLYDIIYPFDTEIIAIMIIVFYILCYLYQIYDVHRLTKLINLGEITF